MNKFCDIRCSSVARIIDVNANRSKEALRVIEDYARFVLDNESLSVELRNIRHNLTEIIKKLESGNPNLLIRARNVQDDIGKDGFTKAHELTSKRVNELNVKDIVIANFKRLEEALRSLVEYTKTISIQSSNKLEVLRFKAYELEQEVSFYLFPKRAFEKVRLYVLVNSNMNLVKDVIKGWACPEGARGADAIQLREKSMSDNKLLKAALEIRKLTLAHKVLFIMNDRVDIAYLANADGVHLGEDDISIRDARKILGADKIIGATSHNIEEAIQAQRDGADYISVGPMFSSPTKPHLKPEGLKYLKEVAKKIKIPYVAIGGINEKNIPSLLKLHKEYFLLPGRQVKYPLKTAISSGIINCIDPFQATKKIKRVLNN